jgi:hypothetical protein
MYLLSAGAYLVKAIIQTTAAKRYLGAEDASTTDRVSGVGTLNKIYWGKQQIIMFSNDYGAFTAS